MSRCKTQIWPRIAAWTLVTASLLLVFFLYTRPDFLVNMANQLWACF